MPNYILLTGCFQGKIVGDRAILDVPYAALDEDIKGCIAAAGFTPNDAGKEDYEDSWDYEDTEEPITMKSLSTDGNKRE